MENEKSIGQQICEILNVDPNQTQKIEIIIENPFEIKIKIQRTLKLYEDSNDEITKIFSLIKNLTPNNDTK